MAVAITLLGRWGEQRLIRAGDETDSHYTSVHIWSHPGTTLVGNLVFLSLLPTTLLLLTNAMLPFEGAQTGLALGVAVFLFGCTPSRLLDVSHTGWDRAFWRLLIDLLRVGGSLYLVGWLVVR